MPRVNPRKGFPRDSPIPVIPRLWAKTTVEFNGCWTFLGSQNRSGHVKISLNAKGAFAHRVSWTEHKGPIPEGKMVLHKCVGNGCCWNPTHLYLGDSKSNARDMVLQGRNYNPKGELANASKLKEADVVAIKQIPFTVGNIAVGKMFGVSEYAIYSIRKNLTWAHV
jgi:hypothetical protein